MNSYRKAKTVAWHISMNFKLSNMNTILAGKWSVCMQNSLRLGDFSEYTSIKVKFCAKNYV